MTRRVAGLSPPVPLDPSHILDGFDSGVAPLDDWLKRHARHNEGEGGSRTYVLCADARVVGYYSLAASSVLPSAATGRVRRNMPNPVPVVLLGRLAIDRSWQGKGLGADLLRDAVVRIVAASDTIGVRAILIHAISDDAKAFYERHGFKPSPVDAMVLMMTISDAKQVLVTSY